MTAPFNKFKVGVYGEYDFEIEVTLEETRYPSEEQRKFVEDAIREKIDREAAKG